MEQKVFACLWAAIHEHQMISHTYLQRKFNLSCREAVRYVREFYLKEIIPLQRNIKQVIYLQNTSTTLVNHRELNKRKRMIVVLGGLKGGGGKSTLAINLVTILTSKGKSVLFVDADELYSASDWSEHRENLKIPTPWTTVKLAGSAVRTEVLKLRKNFDEIIIDVGGRDTTSQRAALTIADVFVAPFKPRALDIWTIEQLRKLIEEIKVVNPKLSVKAVLNQADSRGGTNESAIKIIKEEQFLTCMSTIIKHRVSFANSISDGYGIIEMKNKDQKSIQEIMSFYKEIYEGDADGQHSEKKD